LTLWPQQRPQPRLLNSIFFFSGKERARPSAARFSKQASFFGQVHFGSFSSRAAGFSGSTRHALGSAGRSSADFKFSGGFFFFWIPPQVGGPVCIVQLFSVSGRLSRQSVPGIAHRGRFFFRFAVGPVPARRVSFVGPLRRRSFPRPTSAVSERGRAAALGAEWLRSPVCAAFSLVRAQGRCFPPLPPFAVVARSPLFPAVF